MQPKISCGALLADLTVPLTNLIIYVRLNLRRFIGTVWSYSEAPTTPDNKVVSGSESFIGTETLLDNDEVATLVDDELINE